MDQILSTLRRHGFHHAAASIRLADVDPAACAKAWELFEQRGWFYRHDLVPFVAPKVLRNRPVIK
jgi:hypothetical protein